MTGVRTGCSSRLLIVSAQDLYRTTGLQQLPLNTIYQLVAARGTAALELRRDDAAGARPARLLAHRGGRRLRAHQRLHHRPLRRHDRASWALDLAQRVGVPWAILPLLRDPGDRVGWVVTDVASALDLHSDVPVIAVGSHDTASAVVGVPAEAEDPGRFAYISSGTWSLVGLELDGPVLTEAARLADFTNEGGVDGTVRVLKNVMGLWVLSGVRARVGGAGDRGHRPAHPARRCRRGRPAADRASTSTTPPCSRRAPRPTRCPTGSSRSRPGPASRCPSTASRWCAASWTPSPWPTARHLATAARLAGLARPPSCTWSAAARRTPCSAG